MLDYRKKLLTLTALVILGGGLRLFYLDHQSFWNDEFATIRDSSIEKSRVLRSEDFEPSLWDRRIWQNPHGPLYYAILHIWAGLGTNEFTLRLLSVLIGTATIPLIFLLGEKLFDSTTGLGAAFLLAISPFHLWYSQEVRMYVLLMFCATIAVYAFLRLLEEPTPRWAAIHGIAAVLSVFSFPAAGATLLAINLYFLLFYKRHRHAVKTWLLTNLGAGLCVGIFLILAFPFFQRLVADSRLPVGREDTVTDPGGIAQLGYAFFVFSTGYSVGPSLRELHESPTFSQFVPYIPVLIVFALTFAGAFVIGLVRAYRDRQTFAFLLLVLLLPLLLIFGVSSVKQTTFNVRYVAPSVMAFIIILSAGVTGLRRRYIQGAIAAALVGCSLYAVGQYYFNPRYAKADVRSAAAYVAKEAHEGDVITGYRTSAFRFYFTRDLEVIDLGGRHIAPNRLSELKHRLGGSGRAWFILKRKWESDPNGVAAAWFKERGTAVIEKTFPGVSVTCYSMR